MTIVNSPESRQYFRQTSWADRVLATSHPLIVWLPFATCWFVGAILCGIKTVWWASLPIAAVGGLHLLPLRWNLHHRDEASRAVALRRRAARAGLRAHPAQVVGWMAGVGFVDALVRLPRNGLHGGWLLVASAGSAAVMAGIAATLAWRARRHTGASRQTSSNRHRDRH